MNIVLMGYRGAGKTAVGRELARRLGRSFCDTDLIVQERSGRTIADMVADGGWETFRRLERLVIEEISAAGGERVIAVGGGAVLDDRNVRMLKKNGVLVWLQAEVGTLMARMTNDDATTGQRPPLTGEDPVNEAAHILAERLPRYRAVADVAVATDHLDVPGVVEAVMKEMNLWQVML